MWVRSLGQEDPLEEGTATHSSISVGEPPGQRSLVGYSPWGQKESDMTEVIEHHTCSIYTAHTGLSETNKKMSKSSKRQLKFLLWNKKKSPFSPNKSKLYNELSKEDPAHGYHCRASPVIIRLD